MSNSIPSDTTIQDANVAALNEIGARAAVNSAVLDVWAIPSEATTNCATDAHHGKAVCIIVDAAGQTDELCLACAAVVVAVVVNVPDSHTCVDVLA
jgi:hypothetical protein